MKLPFVEITCLAPPSRCCAGCFYFEFSACFSGVPYANSRLGIHRGGFAIGAAKWSAPSLWRERELLRTAELTPAAVPWYF